MNQSLSQSALEIIENYLNLPFPGKHVCCPYFNNRRVKIRGGLRVLVGKGTPQDIVDEATLLSLKEKTNLKTLNDEELKKFLVEHKLGVDCSGFAYHVLDAEMKARNLGSLQKVLKRPWFKNPIRKLLVKLRPIENTGVGTFNHEVNSFAVNLKDVQPGDIIILMGAGIKKDYNHILIIHKIEQPVIARSEERTTKQSQERREIASSADANQLPRNDIVIHYSHSFQYSTDGQYNHGVRQESITITNPNKNILEQNWSEPQMQNYAKTAKETKIKRLKI